MRQKFNPQLHLFISLSNTAIACELAKISEILDANPRLLDLVYHDLVGSKRDDQSTMNYRVSQLVLDVAFM